MVPTSRKTLKEWCLRKLGHPVIEINGDDDQWEDRIDEAFQFFQQFHYDGIEKVILKHQLTQEDIDTRTIPLSDAVIGVKRLFPITETSFSSGNIFNAKYQFRLNDVFDATSTSIIHFDMTMQHLALLDFTFTSAPIIEFNRHMGKLAFNWDTTQVEVGQYILIEAMRILDPADFPSVYNDMWLKQYTFQLFKQQWGANLKKYQGVALIGGMTLDGQTIWTEANEAINKLEQEIQSKFEEPVDFFMG